MDTFLGAVFKGQKGGQHTIDNDEKARNCLMVCQGGDRISQDIQVLIVEMIWSLMSFLDLKLDWQILAYAR